MKEDHLNEAVDVETELSRRVPRLRFTDPAMENAYRTDIEEATRLPNRAIVMTLTLLVDMFFLPELQQAPEIVTLSLILRFAVLTPTAILLVWLDCRGRLGTLRRRYVAFLCLLPTALVAVEVTRTTSAAALPNIQAVPLILLVLMCARISIADALVVVLGSCACFIAAIFACPAVPSVFVPTMILTDLALGVAAIVFAIQLEVRERRVFLLQLRAEGRNRALANLVRTDALTGVANRRHFNETLDTDWTRALRQPRPLGLLMVDVDNFKAYNDHYGHQQGDHCLREVAQAIKRAIRARDVVARYGGEEFAVILADTVLPEVLSVADRILTAVRALALPHEGIDPPGTVSVSLGAASLVPTDPRGARYLVERADRGLYEAKANGRDQARIGTLPETVG